MAKLWSTVFRCRRRVKGTDVTGGERSNTALSSLNQSRRPATIAYSPTVAMLAICLGNVSAGLTDDDKIYVECNSLSKPTTRKYILIYDDMRTILQAFVTENGNKIPFDLANDKFVHWSVFVPKIVQLLHSQNALEFQDTFKILLNGSSISGVSVGKDRLFILNNHLYYSSLSDFILTTDEIEDIEVRHVKVKQDFTDFGLKKGFEFAYSPNSSKQTETKTSKSVLSANFVLPWKEPLDDSDKDLIPCMDLSKVKIPFSLQRIAHIVKEEQGAVNNILLYGEGGCGKSTACKILAQLWQVPYRFINFHLNSEVGDLIGEYKPVKGGDFEFAETNFSHVFEHGGVIELAEINYARPGALGALNSALDSTGKLILGDGRVIPRHPNCIVIVTTNVDYAGCQMMNEALKDRFHQIVLVEKLPADDLVDIAAEQSGLNDRGLLKKMVDAVEKISIKIKKEGITGGVCSTRQLINWAMDVKYSQDPIESAQRTILPGVSLDLEVQEDILQSILRNMF